MTLCTAYIRQANDTEELVFATDSCLTGGEKWKHGIKLFELPRKDCLLCFAGDTIRAYPLVLNLVSSIHLDKYLQSPSATLEEVLEFLSEQFTTLVKTITEVDKDQIHEERGSAAISIWWLGLAKRSKWSSFGFGNYIIQKRLKALFLMNLPNEPSNHVLYFYGRCSHLRY